MWSPDYLAGQNGPLILKVFLHHTYGKIFFLVWFVVTSLHALEDDVPLSDNTHLPIILEDRWKINLIWFGRAATDFTIVPFIHTLAFSPLKTVISPFPSSHRLFIKPHFAENVTKLPLKQRNLLQPLLKSEPSLVFLKPLMLQLSPSIIFSSKCQR